MLFIHPKDGRDLSLFDSCCSNTPFRPPTPLVHPLWRIGVKLRQFKASSKSTLHPRSSEACSVPFCFQNVQLAKINDCPLMVFFNPIVPSFDEPQKLSVCGFQVSPS
eukprot:Protomagalhaensia_sp_Gyna_25__322@NODE_1150_length_2134_cov_138_573747_g914_i0_p3_GENE_NODE_1150_length_2134_cov_138_573747_g914_i0NODE_1150_length_2134_cov_138_573747_g914_i0_p3_ORF_typecomplete_len107_score11_96_NODE_1150_length_2134_cov_138_573747_g914_i017632083